MNPQEKALCETVCLPPSPLPPFILTGRACENPLLCSFGRAQPCCEELDLGGTMDWTLFSDLLSGGETTEATAGASERSLQGHFSTHTVSDLEDEGP